MNNLCEKKITDVHGQRIKKPICGQKKDNVARICSNDKCTNNGNQIMCGLNTCSCNQKTHSKCYQFINFHYLTNMTQQIQKRVYEDLFSNILKELQQIAKFAISKYNQILQVFDYYMMPKPVENVLKSIYKTSVVNKNQALELKKYFNEFPEFKLPELNKLEEYKKGTIQISELIKQHNKLLKEFYIKLFKSLTEHEKTALIQIENYNVQFKKQRSALDRSQNRNQSRSNSR